jgi:hypothetical protein
MRTNTAGMKSIDFRPPPDNGKGLVIVAMAIVVTGVPSLRMGAVGDSTTEQTRLAIGD